VKLINPKVREAKQKAGRKGGQATFSRYGHEHYVEMGKKGGRPRALTLDEIIRRSELQKSKENIAKEPYRGDSLKMLKKLWRDRQNSRMTNRGT
jgi:general stress protein YciG